jgi:hypothetical protein
MFAVTTTTKEITAGVARICGDAGDLLPAARTVRHGQEQKHAYGESRYGRADASCTWLVVQENSMGERKLQTVMERVDGRVLMR